MTPIQELFFYKCDSLLLGVDPQSIKTLEKEGIERSYKKNAVIFKEGSYPEGMYFIKKGKVKIYQLNPDGKAQIVYIYIKGEYFGFRPILSNSKNPAAAETLDDCVVIFYPRHVFNSTLRQSPVLTLNLLTAVSYEFNVWVNLMTAFSHKTVRARVALALLILQEKFRKSPENPIDWISVSRDDIASFSGTTQETCVRILTQFREEKLITAEGRKIKLVEEKALYAISNI